MSYNDPIGVHNACTKQPFQLLHSDVSAVYIPAANYHLCVSITSLHFILGQQQYIGYRKQESTLLFNYMYILFV